MIVFQQGDWGINKTNAKPGAGPEFDGVCLRHMSCTTDAGAQGGHCACSGGCWNCKTKVPDDIKGFFALVKWKR